MASMSRAWARRARWAPARRCKEIRQKGLPCKEIRQKGLPCARKLAPWHTRGLTRCVQVRARPVLSPRDSVTAGFRIGITKVCTKLLVILVDTRR